MQRKIGDWDHVGLHRMDTKPQTLNHDPKYLSTLEIIGFGV